jgi:hypothetical protein
MLDLHLACIASAPFHLAMDYSYANISLFLVRRQGGRVVWKERRTRMPSRELRVAGDETIIKTRLVQVAK